jgi:8-oxo-dGTP pyrophosphatase MutT (NUDIX family)
MKICRGERLAAALDEYLPSPGAEARDLERVRELATRTDPWDRAAPLHATGSAIVLDPTSGRVLLRWHGRMGSWLQVGGHVDVGETHPFDVAQREAREETGLPDLTPWPDPSRPLLVHVVIVPVPAGRGEPAHEHADFRYLLATTRPQEALPESASAELRWHSIPEALAVVAEANLQVTLARVAEVLRRGSSSTSAARARRIF